MATGYAYESSAAFHRFQSAPFGSIGYLDLGARSQDGVVLLHGVTDCILTWLPAINALPAVEPAVRVVALDMPGHGSSIAVNSAGLTSASVSLEALAGQFISGLKSIGLAKIVLVGHSMGGLVAQQMAKHDPAFVSALVLVASSCDCRGNHALTQGVTAIREILDREGYGAPSSQRSRATLGDVPGMKTWLAVNWIVEPAAEPELLEAMLSRLCAMPINVVIAYLDVLLQHGHVEAAHEFAGPVDILFSRNDPIFGLSHQIDLRERFAASGKFPVTMRDISERKDGNGMRAIEHNIPWSAPGDIAKFLNGEAAIAGAEIVSSDVERLKC